MINTDARVELHLEVKISQIQNVNLENNRELNFSLFSTKRAANFDK